MVLIVLWLVLVTNDVRQHHFHKQKIYLLRIFLLIQTLFPLRKNYFHQNNIYLHAEIIHCIQAIWLITWPYHRNLASSILSVGLMQATPSVFLMTLFLFLSFRETPRMGSSIYDVHKKSGFWPLSPVHMRPHEPDPTFFFVDVHMRSTWNTHHSLETASRLQWPSGPNAEIQLYDCNLFKTTLLVIYITNLYHRKIFTFYSVQRRNSGFKKRQFLCMRRRQDDISGL